MIELPKILDIPDKMLPMITDFNNYRYLVLDGGRGSGKTQGAGRFILYLADNNKIRVVCGRETQSSIESSVYTVLRDIIKQYELDFEIRSDRIICNHNGSEILFKGFREQGAVNIKGLEGVDILWVDEAQALTKDTIDVIVPTIRKENSKIFFTMNRYIRNDPAYALFVNRDDCCHIHIDYFENPFCPETLKIEAEECKNRSENDYNHIWLGNPLERTDDYLFNAKDLDICKNLEEMYADDSFIQKKVLGVDFAGKGADLCVASLLTRGCGTEWKLSLQDAWDDPDTNKSVGFIVNLIGKYQPDIIICDVGGLGYPMFMRLKEIGVKNLYEFDGAGASKLPNALNQRACGYLVLRDFITNRQIIIKDDKTLAELEGIKINNKSDGRIKIQSKEDMKKEGGHSPDRADSVMMGVYAIRYLLPKNILQMTNNGTTIKRINKKKWEK